MPSIGKVTGLCADYSKATYNGRPYNKIYDRILKGQDFRFNEMMKRGGIPCELGHPIDFDPNGIPRTEPDPTKIAVILTEVKPGGPQKLMASGEIMDTPNGRIFKTLSEYYNFGLSSRGSYEIDEDNFSEVEGPDGWNQDSYIFKGFDVVLLPANTGSVLSVTEGIGSGGKVIRAARESIDVNLLAKASQVSEEEVNKALDELFKLDEKAEKDKEITVPEMKEELEEKEKKGESLDGEEASEPIETALIEEGENPEENEDNNEESESSIVNDNDVERIKADLSMALDQIKSLTEGKEKDSIELSNRDAEIVKLTSDNEDLKSELEERIAESEQLTEKFEALRDMANKLLDSYKAAKEEFEKKLGEPRPAEEELKGKLDEIEKREKEATECYNKERAISSGLRKELAAAKESLISNYSMTFGISEQSLRGTLGKSYQVKSIKAAAEALANQAANNISIPTIPVVRRRASSTESLEAEDQIERELLAQIKSNN